MNCELIKEFQLRNGNVAISYNSHIPEKFMQLNNKNEI